ncbi:MAG: hypothetical protein M3Z87_15870 [Lactobacillus sp.]|nr:hypothetical protein [Lactobacillus sp.]
MLMNGKEVNHLVVNGEAFSKNVFGQKCNVNKNIDGSCTIDDQGNVVASDLPIGYTDYFTTGHNKFIQLLQKLRGHTI